MTDLVVLGPLAAGCQGATTNPSGTASTVPARNESESESEPTSPAVVPPEPLRIIKIATATHHACVLLSDGTLRCWGEAIHGQLGYGNTTDVTVEDAPQQPPVDVGGKVIDVSAGMRHTCVVLDNGDVRCFGSNEHWQLGVLEAYFGEVPELRPGFAFGMGGYRSRYWPEDDGKYAERRYPAAMPEVRKRLRIGDDEPPAVFPVVDLPGPAVEIDVGQSHSCARLGSGDVYCWGWQEDSVSRMPHRVNLGAWPVQMSAGRRVTCVVTHAQKVRCWGNSHPMRQPAREPEHVCTEAMSRRQCKAAIAALQPGAFGRLGYVDVVDVRAEDVASVGDVGAARPAWQMGEDFPRAIVHIEVGDRQICGLTPDQRIACWGSHLATWNRREPVGANAMAFVYADVGNPEWTPRMMAAHGSDLCFVLRVGEGDVVACWAEQLGWLPRGLDAKRRAVVEPLEPIDVLAVQDGHDYSKMQSWDTGNPDFGYLGRGSRLWYWSGADGPLMPADGIEFNARSAPSLDLD